MDYFKAFEKIKTALLKTDIPVNGDHFAAQIRLTDDDCSGIFYIEKKDMQLFVEPYDYYDNNADITVSFKDFKNIADGKLDAKKAYADGKISISGDAEGFFSITAPIYENTQKKSKAKKDASKKPAVKSAKKRCSSKTPAEPKPESKTTAKSTKTATLETTAKKAAQTAKETK